jgi:Transglycosylase SLT domain
MAGLGTFTSVLLCLHSLRAWLWRVTGCFWEGSVVRSRIPASGAIVVSTTVSAALALCLLSGLAGGVAAAPAPTVTDDASAGTMAAATSAAESTTSTTWTTNATSTTNATTAPDEGDVLYTATTSKLAGVAASTDTGLSLDTQSGLGLLGGVAAEQIPAAAGVVSPATVVAAQATLPIAVASPAVPKPVPAAVLPAIAGTPRQMAYAIAVRDGLDAAQWSCLSQLWQQESKFQTNARNVRSGAFGIPQALPASRMASAGADWRTNPVTQIRWGLTYIKTRYGTACTAWSHWKRHGWY